MTFINLVRFNPTAGGTANFVVSTAVSGCSTPEGAYAIDGKAYFYVAKSADGTQFEYGSGTYTYSTHTLARTNITASSNGNALVNFTFTPVVDVFPAAQPYLEPQTKPMRGHIWGLILSTAGSSTTFTVAAGECADSTGAALITSAGVSKTTAAWAPGSGNGGLVTGTIANNTWYHVFMIYAPIAGGIPVIDCMIATSVTPTLPTGYTLYRRIGSMSTNGSGQWFKFTQNNDEFLWDVAIVDVNNIGNLGTSPVTRTLSVPTGIKVDAIFHVDPSVSTGIDGRQMASALDKSDESTGWNFGIYNGAGATQFTGPQRMIIRTNTSGQIRTKAVTSSADVTLFLKTQGWIDTRGRLS